MHEYIMNITLAKGSGEYCINHILAPSTQARMPLVDRIADLRKDVSVTFVYGDHDWMDPIGGKQSIEAMKKAGNNNGKLYIINNAGHHGRFSLSSLPPSSPNILSTVYMDNVSTVNDLLIQELDR